MDSTWGVDTAAELDDQLAAITGAIERIRELPWWRLHHERLLDAAHQVETLSRSLGGAQIRVAAEIDERGLAKDRAVASTAKLLSQMLAITPGEAWGRVRAAALTLPVDPDPEQQPVDSQDPDAPGEAAVELPVLAAAVDAGQVGADHTRVIMRTMQAIPGKVEEHLRRACEQLLVDQAQILDANRLKDVAEQIRNITDPDGTLNDLTAANRAELFIGTRRGDGLTPIRGLLDDLALEYLRQSIEPLAKPQPTGAGEPDPRPAATRRAQALAEVCRRYLTAGAGPTTGGVQPHASVTIDLDDLRRGTGGHARADYVGALSTPLARLLLCDAAVGVHLTERTGDGRRRVVDAHPERRLISAAQRRALAARDGCCAWPGCDIPAGWCIGHHIKFWAEGGPTTIGNGVLLCGFHHGQIHLGHWTSRINPDDHLPEFIPPRWLDPTQQPRRNHRIDLPDGTLIDAPAPSDPAHLADATEPPGLADLVEPSDLADMAESTDMADPSEPPAPSNPREPVEPPDPTDLADLAEPTDPTEPTDPPGPPDRENQAGEPGGPSGPASHGPIADARQGSPPLSGDPRTWSGSTGEPGDRKGDNLSGDPKAPAAAHTRHRATRNVTDSPRSSGSSTRPAADPRRVKRARRSEADPARPVTVAPASGRKPRRRRPTQRSRIVDVSWPQDRIFLANYHRRQ